VNEDYLWMAMDDDTLARRLKEEQSNARRKMNKRDRAIARKNVEAIMAEQTRRYEAKWLED
jgi:hypothetical protein